MKIRYDPNADALYIKLREEKIHETKELDKDTIVDYDQYGKVIGVEILFVKERNPEFLKDVSFENIY